MMIEAKPPRIQRKELAASQLAALPSANKPRVHDHSALFRLVGGSFHEVMVRSFAPWEDITFPNGDRYEYSDEPISRRSKAHVYKWVSGQ